MSLPASIWFWSLTRVKVPAVAEDFIRGTEIAMVPNSLVNNNWYKSYADHQDSYLVFLSAFVPSWSWYDGFPGYTTWYKVAEISFVRSETDTESQDISAAMIETKVRQRSRCISIWGPLALALAFSQIWAWAKEGISAILSPSRSICTSHRKAFIT